MKRLAPVVAFLAILLSLSSSYGYEQIFSEEFNTGAWQRRWSGDWRPSPIFEAKTGLYSAGVTYDMEGMQDYVGELTSPEMDTSEASYIMVEFWRRLKFQPLTMSNSDPALLEIYFYDGEKFILVETFGFYGDLGQGVWFNERFARIDSRFAVPNFKIRFKISGLIDGDYSLYMDSVKVGIGTDPTASCKMWSSSRQAHRAAGRAYLEQVQRLRITNSNYYAVGSNEAFGNAGDASPYLLMSLDGGETYHLGNCLFWKDLQPGDDYDGDGFPYKDADGNKLDCKDMTNASIYPGAVEICGDGIDQDCDGVDLTDCPPEPCREITATNDDHLKAGRAWLFRAPQSRPNTTYYAKESNQSMGNSARDKTTLFTIDNGYKYYVGMCP